VPDKILVKIENGYFYSMTGDYWRLIEVEPDSIIHEIDQIVNRRDLGNNKLLLNWKTYTDKIDNDASLTINEETGKVEEFIFRADLREDGLVFLMKMIELGQKYDWIFMDTKGNLANPNFGELKHLISKSDKLRFLKAPYKFLEGLNSEEKEKE
jgi:hypothetical protein